MAAVLGIVIGAQAMWSIWMGYSLIKLTKDVERLEGKS